VNVEISKRARRQIERIQAWWVKERPAAPGLFLEELATVDRILRTSPELGSIYAEHASRTVRRVVMPKTRHHLYYRYRADRDELTVLCVWGSKKERGPKL
jgi:plasmid stabilization system protein ParE